MCSIILVILPNKVIAIVFYTDWVSNSFVFPLFLITLHFHRMGNVSCWEGIALLPLLLAQKDAN
jgi:hypothetical protein